MKALTRCGGAVVTARLRSAIPLHLAASASRQYHVVMLGTDDVSLPTLKALHDSLLHRGPYPGLITRLRVLCPSDRQGHKARGRGETKPVPVKAYCMEHGIEDVAEVPTGLKDLSTAPALIEGKDTASQPFAADLGVVVSFGYFIPKHFLSRLRLGAINMHPSLLPKFRGAAPIPHTILSGDGETGVSVIEIHPEKFDAGNILWQDERIPIAGDMGSAALRAAVAQAGSRAMLQTIAELDQRRSAGRFKSQEQLIEEAGSSAAALFPRAPKLHALQGLLCWSETGRERAIDAYRRIHEAQHPGKPLPKAASPRLPSELTKENVLRLFRALDDSSFGVYSHFGGKRIKLLSIARPTASQTIPSEIANAYERGTLAYTKSAGLQLCFGGGEWVRLERVQMETKSAQSGDDFARGYHIGAQPNNVARLEDPPAPPTTNAAATA